MACFIHYPADLGPARIVPIDRRILRFGSTLDNDVVLSGSEVFPHHMHLTFEKQSFTLSASDSQASFLLLGKAKRSHKLSDQELIRIGDHLLRFSLADLSTQEQRPQARPRERSAPYAALQRFTEKLLSDLSLSPLLSAMLDELIALTRADKAFLLLALDGQWQVQVARNIDSAKLGDAQEAISDSIVRHVLDTGEPLLVDDALSHADFSHSRSVMRLRLSSVMAVPLRIHQSTLGVIYLGNDNAISCFDPALLDVVRSFGAIASLILENALVRRDLELRVEGLNSALEAHRFGELIGACTSMRDIYRKIERVASTDVTVLIEGETGTGKELVARAIHQRSGRAKKPFIVINCGAIPENLLESELFGHVRGAFTGATHTVPGKFQAAHGGTLFLDEIGEMPLALQVKMLRALQERMVQKVGDTKPEYVDIRIVAATNKRLSEEVAGGRFREDLFYRLNVISLELPPLRERDQDALLIARYLLNRLGPDLVGREVNLSPEAARAILRWRWPGNIRELENRLKKAIIFSDHGLIHPQELDLAEDSFAPILTLADAREEWQRHYINKILALHDGNRSQTARVLDVDPRTIFRHLERERSTEPGT